MIPLCSECHMAYHSIEPNGGIYKSVNDPAKVVKIIDEVFDYIDVARWPEGREWHHRQRQADNLRQTIWRFWTYERRRNKNLHHSPPKV